VGKKKKPRKKKIHPSPFLSEEQETQLISLLNNFKEIRSSRIHEQIPSPELAQAFVDRLPNDDPEAIHTLLAIREAFPQKNVQKAVRKTVFRFKQRGISHPVLESGKGQPILVKRVEEAQPSGYLGPIDGSGSRGILLILPQIPKGVDVGMGAVSDELGILQFFFGSYSKKRMKEVKDLFFSNFPLAVETSISHVATVLERAYGKNEERLNDLSRGYLQLRPWILENISLLERAAVYDLISLDSISKQGLTDSQIERLLGQELMMTWMIDPERMKPLLDDIRKVKESRILVSEAQKNEQMNEAKRKAITRIYPEQRRELLKWRLEEMAYLFFKRQEEEMARLCLAAGQSLDEKDSPLQINPFLEAVVERSLAFYVKEAQQMQEPKGVIGQPPSKIVIP